MVLVDTSIWSLSLRRKSVDLSPVERQLTRTLYGLIRQRDVRLLGVTRLEVLSGIRDESQFQRIRGNLRGFPDVEMELEDYEEAARISNDCRRSGIADSSVDMLLCSVSLRRGWEIFTTDRDFIHYARIVPIRMYSVSQESN
jgi:predicted nucleic acid-binding protein